MTGGPADGGPSGPIFDPPLSLPTPPPVEGEDGGHRRRVLWAFGAAAALFGAGIVGLSLPSNKNDGVNVKTDDTVGATTTTLAPTNDRTRSLVAPVFAPFTFSAAGVANTTTVPAGNPNGSLPSVSPKTLAALAGVVASGCHHHHPDASPAGDQHPDAGRAEQHRSRGPWPRGRRRDRPAPRRPSRPKPTTTTTTEPPTTPAPTTTEPPTTATDRRRRPRCRRRPPPCPTRRRRSRTPTTTTVPDTTTDPRPPRPRRWRRRRPRSIRRRPTRRPPIRRRPTPPPTDPPPTDPRRPPTIPPSSRRPSPSSERPASAPRGPAPPSGL